MYICEYYMKIYHVCWFKNISCPFPVYEYFTCSIERQDFMLLLLLVLEHNSSGPCVLLSALGLLTLIVRSKAGERCFVPQSVSFVRVDMEEGVKQLDKMALMCLKNLLSLIKAHTHAPQRQTEQTQFSAASAEWLFSPGFSAASLCAWNQDQVGFVTFFPHLSFS